MLRTGHIRCLREMATNKVPKQFCHTIAKHQGNLVVYLKSCWNDPLRLWELRTPVSLSISYSRSCPYPLHHSCAGRVPFQPSPCFETLWQLGSPTRLNCFGSDFDLCITNWHDVAGQQVAKIEREDPEEAWGALCMYIGIRIRFGYMTHMTIDRPCILPKLT